MILKTCILKIKGSGIKTIQQSPILNTMHVSGKGHLHNKRYGPYNFFGRVKKNRTISIFGTPFKNSKLQPLVRLGPCFSKRISLNFREVALKNTAEPNTQHHARF